VSRPAVFLDRDGVLIASEIRGGMPHPVHSAERMRLLPGVQDACRKLDDEGLALVVVTNQPDVARGITSEREVFEVNQALMACLPLLAVEVCLHDDDDHCACRKPLPGMLVASAEAYGLDLHRSVMVGDRGKDIQAGRSAGCRTVLVDGGHDEQVGVEPDLRCARLADAVGWILRAVAQSSPRR
jgi:D-glycero-D-manno-heptose 1,7-bisphosphate phosphatase